MSKQWSGEAELQGLLVELCGHATVPLSKVKQIVTTCNKYVADFKMVVYEIERFIKKANAEDKLAGVYVVDSLCRQHTKEREVFVKRFSIRLRETMSYLQKVPPQDRATLIRLLEEWRKKSVFGPDSLGQILGDYGVAASSNGAMLSPSKGDTDESGKKRLASGAGFVESDVKKATRLCPFREGNCPYGDKCRFDHHGTNTLEQYAARLLKPLVANQQPTAVTVISSDNGERVLNPLQSAIANGSATEETPSESVLDPKFWERTIIRRLHDPNPKDNDEEVPLPSILPTSELKFYRQKSSSAQNEPLPLMVMMANPALSSALPTEYYEISRDSLIDLYVANAAPPKAV